MLHCRHVPVHQVVQVVQGFLTVHQYLKFLVLHRVLQHLCLPLILVLLELQGYLWDLGFPAIIIISSHIWITHLLL